MVNLPEDPPRGAAENALLAALVEASQDAIISKDVEGTILSWNAGAERIYGWSAAEIVGLPVSTLVPPDRLDELEELMESVRRGESLDQHETVRVRKDGHRITVSVTISPTFDADGQVTGAAVVARDITRTKRVEDELRRSNADLEQFAYVASHDLSEPLRAIGGFVDLLARHYEGQLDPQADRWIDFITSGVERMQTLIDDLLAYSRAGRVSVRPVPVDVPALVEGIVQEQRAAIADRRTQVEIGDLPVISAEPVLLQQVFRNLIANAVKFTDRDDARVRVGAERIPGGWRFDVADNGPGIEPHHAQRVFEMFKRLHNRDVPGTGIGLAIAKRVVERHQGEIWVEPAAGGGCIFSFTIPDDPRGEDERRDE